MRWAALALACTALALRGDGLLAVLAVAWAFAPLGFRTRTRRGPRGLDFPGALAARREVLAAAFRAEHAHGLTREQLAALLGDVAESLQETGGRAR